ncbi:MAG: monofunctional biosynthetic peptidoglycan transglycosylase [Desulfobacterota bacterium]|nr:monofunctional biosynthetic peptidoglycan transglycosylase [Thermodesulfobacteriota bacterium]
MGFLRIKVLKKFFLKIFLSFFFLSIAVVIILRWLNPPVTSFMLQDRLVSLGEKSRAALHYNWADLKKISPAMQIAVIAAEDQNFLAHRGFDFAAIERALKHNQKSRRIRGASTITQQVAKNLFLWRGRSWLRKGLEAYFTVLIELFWDKKRILELYLNTVELGKEIFGVEAAARLYFNKPAVKLTSGEAALLAAVLPNPHRFSVRNPSPYIIKRKLWILRQMQLLGGINYLTFLKD